MTNKSFVILSLTRTAEIARCFPVQISVIFEVAVSGMQIHATPAQRKLARTERRWVWLSQINERSFRSLSMEKSKKHGYPRHQMRASLSRGVRVPV